MAKKTIRFWIASLIVLFLATIDALADAPGLELAYDRHHFETVVEGVPVLHDFVIRNQGSAELQIERVRSG